MAEHPVLPLFTDAYMADTRHLTAAQHGAYLLLLMTAWRMPDCKLPDDDKFLARCAAMDMRTWKANRDVVMAFWHLDDEQKFRQHRLLDERKYVDELKRKNSHAGKASALKRKNRDSTTVPTKTQPKSNPLPYPTLEKDNTIVLSKKDDEIAKVPSGRGTRLSPDWMLPSEWGHWALGLGMTREAIIAEQDRFRDYWIAKTGSSATKADWQATWRNWIRKTLEG